MTTLQKAGNRKLVIVIAQAMLLLMSAYIAYSIYEQNEQEKQREQLQLAISEITDLYRSGQTSTIDLSKMDLFPWDKLHVFGPYTPLSTIQEELGKSWSPSDYFVLQTEAYVLLVFTQNGKIVQHVMYPRGTDDFYKAGEEKDGYTALGHKLRFFREGKAQFVTVGIISTPRSSICKRQEWLRRLGISAP